MSRSTALPRPPRLPLPRRASASAAPGGSAGCRGRGERLRIDLSQAGTLAALEAMVAGFEGCALKRTAKSLCFKRGQR